MAGGAPAEPGMLVCIPHVAAQAGTGGVLGMEGHEAALRIVALALRGMAACLRAGCVIVILGFAAMAYDASGRMMAGAAGNLGMG